jgi:hypothetical protein
MPFKLSDPVSECRRRAADYGRRARTVIEIERFLEMDRRWFSLARARTSRRRERAGQGRDWQATVTPDLGREVIAEGRVGPPLASLRSSVRRAGFSVCSAERGTTVGLAAASAAPVLARPRGPTSLSSVASPRRACCSCVGSASPKWGVAKGPLKTVNCLT